MSHQILLDIDLFLEYESAIGSHAAGASSRTQNGTQGSALTTRPFCKY
jgi:hypothetical protein